MMRISAILLSLVMAFLVMAAQIVQFHHHDENDEICLCLDPTHHCHDAHHDDCDHGDDEDCALHFEDSIIVDGNDHNLLLTALAAVESYNYNSLSHNESSVLLYTTVVDHATVAICADSHSLRAPPVL